MITTHNSGSLAYFLQRCKLDFVVLAAVVATPVVLVLSFAYRTNLPLDHVLVVARGIRIALLAGFWGVPVYLGVRTLCVGSPQRQIALGSICAISLFAATFSYLGNIRIEWGWWLTGLLSTDATTRFKLLLGLRLLIGGVLSSAVPTLLLLRQREVWGIASWSLVPMLCYAFLQLVDFWKDLVFYFLPVAVPLIVSCGFPLLVWRNQQGSQGRGVRVRPKK